MIQRKKRERDPDGDDHTDERYATWEDNVSKKLLVKLLTLVFAGFGFVGGAAGTLIKNDYDRIEKAYSDPKWESIAEHAERLGKLESNVRNTADRVTRLEQADVRQQIIGLSFQVEQLNKRLARKGF